jgi:hypothetical protein
VSSTTVSRDYEPENDSPYSDEEYDAVVDVEGLEHLHSKLKTQETFNHRKSGMWTQVI